MGDASFACNLFALTPAQRQRHTELLVQLAQAVHDVQELVDGYGIRYPADTTTWRALTEWIDLERRCCPFLSFTVRVIPGEPVWLAVTGPEGVKAFLVEELPHMTRS